MAKLTKTGAIFLDLVKAANAAGKAFTLGNKYASAARKLEADGYITWDPANHGYWAI